MIKIIRILASLTFAALAAYSLWDYPYARLPILSGTLLYCGYLYKNRMAWLFVIPALIPVSDLTLYSGRFLLSELDIILMATVAMLLWRGTGPAKPVASGTRLASLAIALMAISYIVSSAINLSYPTGENANSFGIYQSPLNTLRVAKGFLWAMILWPFLRSQYNTDPEKTRNCFIAGLLTGLFLAGIGILWERGVIDSLVHGQDIYRVLGDLLNFSTTYRVTGFFSSMHVGGTAIDGYLIMAIPFCGYVFLSSGSSRYQMASIICLMLGSYAIMVTFSRGLYGAFGMVGLFMAFAMMRIYVKTGHIRTRKFPVIVILYIFATLYLAGLFKYGGYESITGAFFFIVATIYAVPFLQKMPVGRSVVILGVIILFGSYIVFLSLAESKWVENGVLLSAISALATGLIFTAVAGFCRRSLLPAEYSLKNEFRKATLFSLITGIFWLGIIPPLLNVRVNTRFSTTGQDFSHRYKKWRRTLSFRQKGLLHELFGTGVGSFPRYYFFNNYDDELVVNYHYGREGKVYFLSIGYGDFNITQKIPDFEPGKSYILRAKTRERARSRTGTYSLSLELCPKHIIYSDRYIPNCIQRRIQGKSDGKWHQVEFSFNSGRTGKSGMFYWPVALLIGNGTRDTVADITAVQLLDKSGNNLISNGDFSQQGDRWAMIRDYSHDAWHEKNIFIHLIFEQGYYGLMAFLFLFTLALVTQIRAMKNRDPLAPVLIAALTGMLIVGLFGTVIDNPRVTTLYFLLVFFGLLNTAQPGKTE